MKIKNILLVAISVLSIAGCNTIAQPTPPTTQTNQESAKPQPAKESKATVETKDIKETDPNGPITVKYPYTSNEKINKPIKEFVDQAISDFKKDAVPVDPETGAAPNALDISYSTIPFNDDIVTFKYDIYINTGGAHPNSYTFTQTFDLKKGIEYTNKDILGTQDAISVVANESISILKNNIKKALNEAMETTEELDQDSLTWIENGAGPDPANYQAIAIQPDQLVIYFNPYQVAPYAAGPQEVHIPMTKVRSVLPAPFGDALSVSATTPPVSPLNPLPPPVGGKKIACNTDADCVPEPTECHPHACVTTAEAAGKQKPEMCTMMFDTQAAYSAADCTCDLGICKNKNLGKQIDIPDTTAL